MNGKVQVLRRSKQSLVHTVEDGVAGVELDGGEDSLPGGGGSGHGDGTGSVGHGSRGNDLRGGMGNVGNDGSRGGGGQRGDEAVGVGQGKSGGNNLGRTPLPLGRGSGDGSLLGGVSLGESSLGGDDILGVSDLDSLEDGGRGLDTGEDRGRGLDSLEDGGSEVSSASNGEVGALDPEAVDIVGDVVHSLDKAVSINILVGAGSHSISVAGLSPGRWTSGMAERELTKLILSVELVGGGGGGDC